MVITAEDIRNKVRALEKAAAAEPRCAAQVPPDTLKDLVVSQLKTMCKWKKQPGDATLSTTKKALKQLYKKTMHNPSPRVRPYNSNAEEEAGDASDVDSMDSDASVPENDDLEFGKEYEIDKEE